MKISLAQQIRQFQGVVPADMPTSAYMMISQSTRPSTLLVHACCFILLTCLLVACQDMNASQPNLTLPNTSAPLAAITATGHFQEYSLPQTNSGLMRPTIDHEGRIWFGEMGHNYLATFDPRTQTFQQRTPPHGRNGIMGILVAPDDSIWFAEQYANYIGHYFPSSATYQTYSLPTLTIPDPGNTAKSLSLPSAPNDMALDAHGNIWFTELNADSIGKLDPHTGLFQHYSLASTSSVQKLYPYGITVDPQGRVWFTQSINDQVGRLDPSTGKITYFTMEGPLNQFMEIASDAHGTLWITTFNAGLLVSLNSQTGTFTSYYATSAGERAGGIYGLTISPNGEIWISLSAENMLAQLDVAHNRFVYYPIPTKASLPLGVVMGNNSTLWFTEAGSDKLGMLHP
ncbi:MAG: hypothetical protein NVS4B7_02820 [Ktedonobacteraceae bacterium]